MNFLRELWTGRSPKPESSAQGTTSEGQSLKKAQCSLSGPVQDQKQCQLASSKGTTSEEKGSEKAQCSSQGPLQGQKRSRPASSQGTKSVERRAKKAKGAPSSFNDSTWYAWYLVCESMCYQKKVDLANLCLVSKNIKDLAIPFLYRSLGLDISGDLLEETALLCRLLDTPHHELRGFVQEITFSAYIYPRTTGVDKRSISMLIERLPHLRLVRFKTPCDFSDKYMTSIDQHPRKPELHLLAESGEKPCPRSLPRVTVIKVCAVNKFSYVEGQPPPRENHDFLKFITSFPNLKSCSWAVSNPNESTVHQTPGDLEEFDTQKPFPYLEHLALDGHYIGSQMWRGWQDHFNWSSLSSLEIGPQLFALENLKLLTGRLTNLKCLKFTGSDVQNEDLDRSLEYFLMSFDTLVNLELLNCSVPLEVISRHARLSSLCVHIGETWNCLDSRVAYENIDIVSLDALCPLLETLELDIERDSFKEEWPHDVLESLAHGFPRLKTLALHSRVGNLMWRRHPMSWGQPCWREDNHFFEPELTYKTAKEIGSNFFATRHERLGGFGGFQKLTLKAGLNKGLRSYPRGSFTERDAKFNTLTFDMFPPEILGQEPKLVHLERKHQEELCQGVEHPTAHRILEQIIQIADWGPRYPFRTHVGSKTHCRRGVQVVQVGERRSERIAKRRARESMVDTRIRS